MLKTYNTDDTIAGNVTEALRAVEQEFRKDVRVMAETIADDHEDAGDRDMAAYNAADGSEWMMYDNEKVIGLFMVVDGFASVDLYGAPMDFRDKVRNKLTETILEEIEAI